MDKKLELKLATSSPIKDEGNINMHGNLLS
jgi:hypothetical protein